MASYFLTNYTPMDPLPLITEIEQLESFVEKFLSSDELWDQAKVCYQLRKPIRAFKKKYPQLVYFAYGIQKEYKFIVSKTVFNVDYFDLSLRAKKLFVVNTGLKIDPIATREQLAHAYKYLELDQQLAMLSDVLISLGGEKDFVSKHYDLEKKMLASIKNSPNYLSWKKLSVVKKVLLDEMIEQIKTNANYQCPAVSRSHDDTKHGETPRWGVNRNGNILYHQSNHNKFFISIDLKAANFQVMKLNGLINESTWADFVAKHVEHPYFSKLKMLRLRILSSKDLIPAKQQIYWQNLMVDISSDMVNNGIITAENFVVFNSDEVVVRTSKETMLADKNCCKQFISNTYPELVVNTEIFQLKILSEDQPYFVKINPENQKVTFKCVSSEEMAEAIELFENLDKKSKFEQEMV